jgi:DNA-binding transcriptional MerR regulator
LQVLSCDHALIAALLRSQEVSLEEVEMLMEEGRDAKEYEERVRELLAEALTAEDDAAVLQELSQLEGAAAHEEGAQLPAVPQVVIGPAAWPHLLLSAHAHCAMRRDRALGGMPASSTPVQASRRRTVDFKPDSQLEDLQTLDGFCAAVWRLSTGRASEGCLCEV